MPSLYENLKTGKGEPLFQHPTDGTILAGFSGILSDVNRLPMQTNSEGTVSIHMPTFQHNGHPEHIVVTARTFNVGQSDKPKIIFLPPYPFSSKLSKVLFGSRSFSYWQQEGISPFESDETMPAPYRSVLGAVYAYAGGVRMLHERIKDAHDNGQKVGVVGFSYGANVTSAYLTYVDTLPEEERARSIPDKVFAIEGGNILESTLHSTFGKRADPQTTAEINANPVVLPNQTPLSADIAKNTFAVVNNDDSAVLGQSEVWQGAKQFEVKGTHVRAPLRNLLQIRKLLRSHFRPMLN